MTSASAGEYRAVMSGFASGVAIVATAHGEQAWGMAATSIMSISTASPTVAVSLFSTGATCRAIAGTNRLSVNFLGEGEEWLSRAFSKPEREAYCAEILLNADRVNGVPVDLGAHGYLVCRVTESVVASDHTIMIAKVEACRAGRDLTAPLIRHSSAYGCFAVRQPTSEYQTLTKED
ncbi:MAG TPA: flavin reductase family protein [Dermatophilaceae bacterium]|jgi:flavin reductase (DIM6/NTAB) family NADH-FMN oxidoreductase RutF